MTYRIKHRNYVVELDDGTVHELRVITADVIGAESYAPSYGLNDPTKSAITMTLMWCWRAAVRTGVVDCGWPEFVKRCVEFRDTEHRDVVTEGEPTPAEVEVPPTVPGASTGSSSPSALVASPASTSTDGDTPPSTMSGS